MIKQDVIEPDKEREQEQDEDVTIYSVLTEELDTAGSLSGFLQLFRDL